MAFFVGEFDQQIDGKHRVSLSAALREGVKPKIDGEDFYLIVGPKWFLWLYPRLAYENLQGTLERNAIPDDESDGTDLLYGMARLVKPDKQGRIVLPDKSMKRGNLSVQDAVTLVGQGDHIELWPTQAWEQHVAREAAGYRDKLKAAAKKAKRQGGTAVASGPPAT